MTSWSSFKFVWPFQYFNFVRNRISSHNLSSRNQSGKWFSCPLLCHHHCRKSADHQYCNLNQTQRILGQALISNIMRRTTISENSLLLSDSALLSWLAHWVERSLDKSEDEGCYWTTFQALPYHSRTLRTSVTRWFRPKYKNMRNWK